MTMAKWRLRRMVGMEDGRGQQASGRDARGGRRRHIGSVYGGAISGAVIDLTYRLLPTACFKLGRGRRFGMEPDVLVLTLAVH